MKWVSVHCKIAVFLVHWTVWNHYLSQKVYAVFDYICSLGEVPGMPGQNDIFLLKLHPSKLYSFLGYMSNKCPHNAHPVYPDCVSAGSNVYADLSEWRVSSRSCGRKSIIKNKRSHKHLRFKKFLNIVKH